MSARSAAKVFSDLMEEWDELALKAGCGLAAAATKNPATHFDCVAKPASAHSSCDFQRKERSMGTRSEYASTGLMSAAALLVAVLTSPAAGQVTSRVSVDSSGAQADRDGGESWISADGRYVAFHSAATNLVGGDTNGHDDVFVHDRQSGVTERVSIATGGAQGDGDSGPWGPSISGDGRYVAFFSGATNLVGGDTNGVGDTFVHDRQSGVTERVSIATGGAQGDLGGGNPVISADGRYVAFVSGSTNLIVGDTNGAIDIYLHDRQSGTTERVSIGSGGVEADAPCDFPSISADGRYVGFASEATNLVSGDTGWNTDVFVRDRQSGTTERVSLSSGGQQGDDSSSYSSISADGRYVAFYSWADNLVSGDTNGISDVFVHDRQSGTTERVSVDSSGAQGDDISGSFGLSISADGRYVTVDSIATNLVDGDTNGFGDAFVRDRNPVASTKYCTANANSAGSPADLSAFGSASSGAGDLLLTSMPVPNQNGLFFHGTNQSQIPFGNGFMCTTGGIERGAVVMGVGNVATYTYDNSDAKHSLTPFVGTTRNFQHWFRDPAGGGAFFNTSNAISIVVQP